MNNQQSTLMGQKSIEEIRKSKIDEQALTRIAEERKEIEDAKKSSQTSGGFLAFKSDKEKKVLLFLENGWEKKDVPSTEYDPTTKSYKEIPGKTVVKYNFTVYDLTTYDPANPPKAQIWQRGRKDAEQVLYFMGEGVREMVVMRNGAAGSKDTTYTIYPSNR